MAKLLTFVLAISILAGSITFFRLPPNWLTPSFQSILTETIGPVQVDIPQAQIRWGGWRHPLGMIVHNITIEKQEKGLTLKIPSLRLSLKILPLFLGKADVGGCFFEKATFHTNDRLIGEFSGKLKRKLRVLSARVSFENLNVTALSHLTLPKPLPDSLSLPLFGRLTLEGTPQKGVTRITVFCQSNGGSLLLPKLYPQPVSLNQVAFSLTGNGHTLTLKGNLKRGNAHLSIRGKLQSSLSWKDIHETGGEIGLQLEGQANTIAIDDLGVLWPHGLSPTPRKWVTQHLSKGQVTSASAEMKGTLHMSPAGTDIRLRIPYLQGGIEAKGITVNYFGKLPPVVDTKGKCSFTREQFVIDASGMVNGIQLKKAHLVIQDTHRKDQTIDINLNLEGPLRNSLDIINAHPLFLAKKLDLDPARVSGQAKTHVHLTFPLDTNLPLELVNVTAESQITQGEIHYDMKIKGVPLKVDQGSFSLNVSKESLKMEGQANIQTVKANIRWREYFKDKDIPFRREFWVYGDVDLEKLYHLGFPLDGYGKGNAKADIHYTMTPKKAITIEGNADLTPTILVSPILFWQKEKDKTAQLKVKMHKNPHYQTFILDEVRLTAPGLAMFMNGRETPQGNTFNISQLKIGKNQLNATIHQGAGGGVHANVRGNILDLSPLFEGSIPPPLLPPPPPAKESTKIKVGLEVDRINLGNGNALHHVDGNMVYQGGILNAAHLKALPPHSSQPISLTVTPLSKDRHQFKLQSNNGGRLLEMLDAGCDIEGGQLVITGIKSRKEPSRVKTHTLDWEIIGNLFIEDFTVNKSPLLARLLSATSLQGIINFFSGKGIHFYTGEAGFSLTPGTLTLTNARLISPSLGVVLQGSVDRPRNHIHFAGDVIPLYIINTALAHIPLIGPLLSGGREEGIFLTHFTLTGSRQNPALQINPVSSLTPGLVREFLIPQAR